MYLFMPNIGTEGWILHQCIIGPSFGYLLAVVWPYEDCHYLGICSTWSSSTPAPLAGGSLLGHCMTLYSKAGPQQSLVSI